MLIGLCCLCGLSLIAFMINVLFKIKAEGLLCAGLSEGDVLNYIGTMIGAISTFFLGLVAYMQNKKLQDMEDSNYIATNSCIVLIDEIQIKPTADMPVNYELHTEQILKETDNEDECPIGYDIEIRLKKIDASIQATPSLIYVPSCILLVGNDEKNKLVSHIWADNIREDYTRAALFESGIEFKCKLLVSRNKQENFENAIKAEKNKLIIEIQFDIVTDKYVMTKCKCRAYCDYQNCGGSVTWKSNKPMAFFYGHELKNRNEIQVLEG